MRHYIREKTRSNLPLDDLMFSIEDRSVQDRERIAFLEIEHLDIFSLSHIDRLGISFEGPRSLRGVHHQSHECALIDELFYPGTCG